MQQKPKREPDVPTRASDMLPTEESRERMTNRGNIDDDRGTSSDRAMFDDEADPRKMPGSSKERGSGRPGGSSQSDC
jgi:hypothetical protein